MTNIVEQWRAYGVIIEQDDRGYWSWAETEDLASHNPEPYADGVGAFSPPFKTLEQCVSDLEDAFGPLGEQVKISLKD